MAVIDAWRTKGKDRHNPQPLIYPACGTCGTAWVYRRFLSLSSGGHIWAWGRDCKHKGAPETHNEAEVA